MLEEVSLPVWAIAAAGVSVLLSLILTCLYIRKQPQPSPILIEYRSPKNQRVHYPHEHDHHALSSSRPRRKKSPSSQRARIFSLPITELPPYPSRHPLLHKAKYTDTGNFDVQPVASQKRSRRHQRQNQMSLVTSGTRSSNRSSGIEQPHATGLESIGILVSEPGSGDDSVRKSRFPIRAEIMGGERRLRASSVSSKGSAPPPSPSPTTSGSSEKTFSYETRVNQEEQEQEYIKILGSREGLATTNPLLLENIDQASSSRRPSAVIYVDENGSNQCTVTN